MRNILVPVCCLMVLACGDDTAPTDTGVLSDAPVGDASPRPDAGPVDAGSDAGPEEDAGPDEDAGPAVRCLDTRDDDSLENASPQMDLESNAGFPVETLMGTIDPITDVDWYSFHVDDVIRGDVQPRYALAARPAGVIWELCMYFECDSGTDTTSFDCEDGSTPHMVGDIAGCCSVTTEGSASITISPSCSGTISEDGTAYARVSRQGGMVSCEGYDLSYGDD